MLRLKKVLYAELEKRFPEIESWNKLSKNENAYNTKQFSKNSNSDFDWWLAFDGNKFVGAVSVNVNGKDIYINEGMAKPGSGYGEKMLREIFKHYENSINGIRSISFDAWSESNQSKLEEYYNRVFSDFKRTKNSWGGSRYTKTFESRKSIYDEINEEFERLMNEDAILAGEVSNESTDMVQAPASSSDYSVQKNVGKCNDHSITFKDTLGDYTPGDGVMSVKNNYTGNGLSAMQIQKRIKEAEENTEDFKQRFLESDIQGLEHWDSDDLFAEITSQIKDRMADGNVSDQEASIKSMAIVGSRNRNTAKDDSDLDVVLEYVGSIREDDLFNILNDSDNRIMVDDIIVDVNPIRKSESGSIKDFLKKSTAYDNYILSNQTISEKKNKKKRRKHQHFRRFYGYYPWWPIRPIPPPPPPKPPAPPPGPPPPGPGPQPGPEPGPIPSGGNVSDGDAGGAISGGDVGGMTAGGAVGEAKTRYDSIIPPRKVLMAFHNIPERKIMDSVFQSYDLDGDIEDYSVDSIVYCPTKEVYILRIEKLNTDGKTSKRFWIPMDFNYRTRKIEPVKNSRMFSLAEAKKYFNADNTKNLNINMWVVWGNPKFA